jgi:uncharacterized phage protein gp47/JayE
MSQPNIPTFEEEFNRIYGDLQTESSAGEFLIGRVALRAVAYATAGATKLLYLKVARVQKNVSPTTADPVAKGGTLEEWGQLKLGRDLNPSTNGEYILTVTGEEGGEVKLSDQLLSSNSSDNPGYLFEPTEAKVILPGDTSVEVPVRALEAGRDAEVSVSNILEFTKPLAKIDKPATVLSVTSAPTEGETGEQYRGKTVEAYQLETQGGAPSDYRVWLNDVEGTRTVYTILTQGGDLDAYVEAQPADSTDGNGTPPAAMLTEVEEIFEWDPDTTKELNTRGRRPQGIINLDVQAVSPLPVEVTIVGLTDTSSSTLAAIDAAIELLLFDVRPFIAGATDPNKRNDTLYLGSISAVIAQALPAGKYFTSVTMKVATVSVEERKFLNGDLPYLDEVIVS